MRTRLLIHAEDTLISEKLTLISPRQETTEVTNVLLDGSWHVQTVGLPRHAYEIDFIIPGTLRAVVDHVAAEKVLLRMERQGEDVIGIIEGNVAWETLRGSTDPAREALRGTVTLLVTGGE